VHKTPPVLESDVHTKTKKATEEEKTTKILFRKSSCFANFVSTNEIQSNLVRVVVFLEHNSKRWTLFRVRNLR